MTQILNKQAYQLFHEGVLAFADIEDTGIRVDVPYLKTQYKKLTKQLAQVGKEIKDDKQAKQWRSKFGQKTNYNSTTQLSTMLYKVWGIKSTKSTAKGNAAVDDSVLSKIDLPIVKNILRQRKILKIRDTYILGILNEQSDSYLHPSFNLHFVSSFRSSSDGPNFQNQPVRDPIAGAIVRKAFLPLDSNHCFGEVDYSGIEVASNACINRDPNLIAYISDPAKDMHRDVAGDCFILAPERIGKMIRYVGKNGFTFPAFYGSYFEQIAPAMWNAIDEHDLKTEDGVALKIHLASKGIKTLSKFTAHIKKVEDIFWNTRFKVYTKWKKDFYNQYLKNGYIDIPTGFRCWGPMRRNEVTNYPGQGTAFHFLLWSLIQIHRWLKVNEMETKILGQIHDSIVFSFHKDELRTVLKKVEQVMCRDILKRFPWICVPLKVEAEVAPVGGTWNDKKGIKI